MQFLRVGFFLMLIMRMVIAMSRSRRGSSSTVDLPRAHFIVQIARSKQKRPEFISVSLGLADKLRFLLRRESTLDRVFKAFGVVREWQTGDSAFDQRVFIVSEDWALNEALSADRGLRDICADLLGDTRVRCIECKSGRLYVDFKPTPSEPDSDARVAAGAVQQLGPALIKLRDALQRIAAVGWNAARDGSFTRKAWLVGICVTLGILGALALLVSGMDRRHQVVQEVIVDYATWITIAVIGSLLAAVWLGLRASPHTHAVLLDVLLSALPGTFLAAHAGALLYNECFDSAAPRLVPIQVVEAYVRSGKSRSYYLEVSAWPDPRAETSLQIDAGTYEWIRRGGCVVADWRPGALGDGWVASIRQGCPLAAGDVER